MLPVITAPLSFGHLDIMGRQPQNGVYLPRIQCPASYHAMIVDAHPLAILIASDREYRTVALVPDTDIAVSTGWGGLPSTDYLAAVVDVIRPALLGGQTNNPPGRPEHGAGGNCAGSADHLAADHLAAVVYA